jgi:outer membrane protein OmpA-like peptidoglycan-associated protein
MDRKLTSRPAPLFALAAACGALLVASPAVANDIDVSINGKVLSGKGKPSLDVKVNKALKRATIDVRDGKGRHRQSRGPGKVGATLSFPLPHTTPGKRTWQGELQVTFQDGSSGTMPLRFETQVVTMLKFKTTSTPQEIQDEHKVTIEADRACSKIEIEAYGDNGVLIASTGKKFPNAAAGTPLTVDWVPGKEGPVLRLHVTVFDESGMHRSGDFYPHFVSVPHEEVVFETGKAEIRPQEEEKLVAALGEVKKAVGRYSKAVAVGGKRIRLYVAGHTDTVGGGGSNQALSQRRARAIGKWFKDHGVGVAVYVRGFGESMLKVPTPDETDEEQNRRADYDIGVEWPTGSGRGWTAL